MEGLKQEATQYFLNNTHTDIRKAFIAGAKSKSVQIEKIKAQINILNPLRDLDSDYVRVYLSQLEKELNKLEQ
jgi:hypothetical protein